jgi:myo-inositol-1(or 4)-monophosphatase
MGNALIGLDWGHSNKMRECILNILHRVAPQCGTLRALGSATLAMAYVAVGWLDAYFNIGLKPWDAVAGMLILKEAGGRCSTLKGAPYRVVMPDCLATNSFIHDELLSAIQGTDTSIGKPA